MNCGNKVCALLLVGASGMATLCAASATPRQDDGLVGLWKFEEGSGTVVKDSSPNHNDGTIIGADASVWGTGEFAGSISLSDTNGDHVSVPPSASLNQLTKHITVVADIYPRSFWTPRPFWDFWEDKPRGNGFIAIVERQWRQVFHPDLFYLGFGRKHSRGDALSYKWHVGLVGHNPDSLYCLPANGDVPVVGKWVQLTGSYDSDTGKMSLYVDGTPLCSLTTAGTIRLDAESLNRPLIIGAEVNGPDVNVVSSEFDGYIDEVRIYDRVLADTEIKALADESKKRMRR